MRDLGFARTAMHTSIVSLMTNDLIDISEIAAKLVLNFSPAGRRAIKKPQSLKTHAEQINVAI